MKLLVEHYRSEQMCICLPSLQKLVANIAVKKEKEKEKEKRERQLWKIR